MNIGLKNISALIILIFSSLFIALPSLAADSVSSTGQESEIKQKVVKVSINTATAKELTKFLKGIGKAKAEAIIAYRDTNGEFKKVDDLLKVKGIGKKVLENNKDRISL